MILTDCFKVGKKYCGKKQVKNINIKVFLKNCKYGVKKKKVPKYITENEEISPDEENSDK